MSGDLGDHVVDEDQLLLNKRTHGIFSANGWGYSLNPCDIPLRAIFRLTQAKKDILTPMNRVQTARFLGEQVFQLLGNNLPVEILSITVKKTAEIARTIPGYELQFRRSPDFWKLIDAEFGLE